MNCGRDGMRVVLIGVVEVAGRNEEGNATAVAIRNVDDKRYLVENSGHGRGLLNIAGEMVEVVGLLRKNAEGDTVVKVKMYQVLEGGFD